ncbi:MAG: sensory rhodopsin transducer [Spirochaetia bacterium]|jgi:hypothetical protein
MSAQGKKNWVFADGDLPPAGDREPFGHEALMITNLNRKRATIALDILFEDREPVRVTSLGVEGMRVKCFRLDQPLGEQKVQIPFGQYALVVRSDVPVVAVFGRLDVRQPNLAYYSVAGYSFD